MIFSLNAFWFLAMSSSALASKTQLRINVTLVGSVFIQNSTKHFVQIDILGSNRYQVVCGLPPVGHNWTMWRAANDPRRRIFGIQINNDWYFLQVCNNCKSMSVVRQSIPDMVSINSRRWFEYVEVNERPENHFLYHPRTQSYIKINNNKIELSRTAQTASGIEINAI